MQQSSQCHIGVQELADSSPQAKPLRRRTLLVLGQWVPKLADDDRPDVYRAVLHLMANEDAALQLAAVSTLQVCICTCRPPAASS